MQDRTAATAVGMSTPASSSDATPGKDGGPGPAPAAAAPPAAGKKTNVCLICGIYTNLSLNIFEPRNGPNIREVIYQKYNFRAERSDTEDKYICFSCNNWLINWYSLQHLSESRNYESTPSSSRQSQSSENRNKRPKNNGRSSSSAAPGSSRDKENLEQDNVVSSTVKSPEKENASPKRKPKRPSSGRPVLKLSSQHNMISSSTEASNANSTTLVKPFESHLIRMLENQGTSVIKESNKLTNPFRSQAENSPVLSTGKRSLDSQLAAESTNSSDIVLSFNSAISEVVNVLPTLNSLRQHQLSPSCNENDQIDQHFLRTHRMSRSLSISLIDSAPTEH